MSKMKPFKIYFNKETGDHVPNERWMRTELLHARNKFSFEDRLEYVGHQPAASNTQFIWRSTITKKIYVSGVKMVDDILKKGLMEYGVMEGCFVFVKKGTTTFIEQSVNYGPVHKYSEWPSGNYLIDED